LTKGRICALSNQWKKIVLSIPSLTKPAPNPEARLLHFQTFLLAACGNISRLLVSLTVSYPEASTLD
jgi:hypothetical protein